MGLNQFESITLVINVLNSHGKFCCEHRMRSYKMYVNTVKSYRCGLCYVVVGSAPPPACLLVCTFYIRNLVVHLGLKLALLLICALSYILTWCACVLILKVTRKIYLFIYLFIF